MSSQRGAQELVHDLSYMVYNEPVVKLAIEILQAHCLQGGVQLERATPAFQRHLTQFFLPFCREAIGSFLMVGFAPYRIRCDSDTGAKVPELLPIGTYSWSVMRHGWRENEDSQQPLVRYEVCFLYFG